MAKHNATMKVEFEKKVILEYIQNQYKVVD